MVQSVANNSVANIKVVGIGQGGNNAINRMHQSGVRGVELIAMNTDVNTLTANEADLKIELGPDTTRGLGAGLDPNIGRAAAEESAEAIEEALRGADMVILTTGESGGTGTGATPVVARIAKSLGALTVAVVTKPANHEGPKRKRIAEKGVAELKKEVDCISVISNDRIIDAFPDAPITESFKNADVVLSNMIQSIVDCIIYSALQKTDFADIKAITKDAGTIMVGIGEAKGEDRAVQAFERAVTPTLFERNSIEGAKGCLMVAFCGDSVLTGSEQRQIANMRNEIVEDDATTKDGVYQLPELGDMLRIVVIATGFPDDEIPTVSATNHPVVRFDDEALGEKLSDGSNRAPAGIGDYASDSFTKTNFSSADRDDLQAALEDSASFKTVGGGAGSSSPTISTYDPLKKFDTGSLSGLNLGGVSAQSGSLSALSTISRGTADLAVDGFGGASAPSANFGGASSNTGSVNLDSLLGDADFVEDDDIDIPDFLK